ncbi:HTTM domain-containing protein [Lewinella cohaerens]|uniref:HTTM domain-containing protein n=1 Tax=Lewinella cohaerens TaxID=70995 RepID=UPI00316ADAE9
MSMPMGINKRLATYFQSTTSAAPLAVFRIFFGILMLISLIRFAALGWIEKLYLEPSFHFTFYGFGWVKPLGGYTYLLFVVCGLAALMITLGYRYRLAIAVFFCSFTYIELMDKTTYLNHYYFVSVMSFLLFFLPAAAYFSLDARRKSATLVPRWSIDAVKLMLTIVYFYAGLAKLNSDWLLEAKPLSIWLATKDSIPLIGGLLKETWVAYAFSWSGALYDLFIPFLLWYRPTRSLAFVAVVIFHLLTRILFPIGMFPYIMIVSTLIFFGPEFHKKVLSVISRLGEWLGMVPSANYEDMTSLSTVSSSSSKVSLPSTQSGDATGTLPSTFKIGILTCFFALQLLIPFRYQLYPGELFWTEQGFRFSWRVMLMEKAGYAQFKVVDGESGRHFYVDNSEFLNPFQEKQMAFQPDFILEYAHYLAETYRERGLKSAQVYVESYVALNGRGSQPFVDPTVDLAQVEISLKHKNWLLPFRDEIKGL